MQSSFYSSSSSSALTNSFEKSWFSQVSECDAAQPNPVPDNHISVIIGHRPNKVLAGRQQAVRRVIRRENKCIEALSLPIILSYNMRSIWGKLNSFSDDMHERDCSITFLCEVWEKSENTKHQKKIEEMLEMKNTPKFKKE